MIDFATYCIILYLLLQHTNLVFKLLFPITITYPQTDFSCNCCFLHMFLELFISPNNKPIHPHSHHLLHSKCLLMLCWAMWVFHHCY